MAVLSNVGASTVEETMRYFQHRPFTFWLSLTSILLVVLVASFMVGVYTEGSVPAPLKGNKVEAASDMMTAYGSMITAPDNGAAKTAAEELIEVAENCENWGMVGCAEVVQRGLVYVAALEEAETAEPENGDERDPSSHVELVALRRDVGDAVNRVVTNTP